MLWISLVILLAVVVFMSMDSVIGAMYVSSDVTGEDTMVFTHYEMVQALRADPANLNGRPLDTELMQEAMDAMGWVEQITIPADAVEDGQEYNVSVRQGGDMPATGDFMKDYAIRRSYMGVWDTVAAAVDEENMNYDLTGENFYAAWEDVRQNEYISGALTDGEINWWNRHNAALKTPVAWTAYAMGWENISDAAYVVGLLTMLFAAIALAGVFPYERQQRMDTLSMCSKNGRGPLYLAKLLASLTVTFAGAVILFGTLITSTLAVMGTEGFDGMIPFFIDFSYVGSLSIGQLALIACGLGLMAVLVHAAFTLALSLIYKGSIPTMATVFGVMLVSAVGNPFKGRFLNQLYSLFPSKLDGLAILDARLVNLFGHYLTSWQFAPILWTLMLLALAGAGWLLHRRVPNK